MTELSFDQSSFETPPRQHTFWDFSERTIHSVDSALGGKKRASLLDVLEDNSASDAIHCSVPGKLRLCNSPVGAFYFFRASIPGLMESHGLPDFDCLLSDPNDSSVLESLVSSDQKCRPALVSQYEEEEEEEDEEDEVEVEDEEEEIEESTAEEEIDLSREYESPNEPLHVSEDEIDHSRRFSSLAEEEIAFLLDCVTDGTLDLAEDAFNPVSDAEIVDSAIVEEDHSLESLVECARNILTQFSTTDEVGQVLPPTSGRFAVREASKAQH